MESCRELALERHLVGCNDDILDIAILRGSGADSAEAVASVGEEGHISPKFRVAVVTNSAQVRIMDETFSCVSLNGHTDIVLAVDASPDG